MLLLINCLITVVALIKSFTNSYNDLKMFSYKVLACYGVAFLFRLFFLSIEGDYQPLGKALGFYIGSVSGPLLFTVIAMTIKHFNNKNNRLNQ